MRASVGACFERDLFLRTLGADGTGSSNPACACAAGEGEVAEVTAEVAEVPAAGAGFPAEVAEPAEVAGVELSLSRGAAGGSVIEPACTAAAPDGCWSG